MARASRKKTTEPRKQAVELGEIVDLELEPGPYLMAGPDGSVGTTGPGTYRFNLAGDWRLLTGDGKTHVATYTVTPLEADDELEDDLEGDADQDDAGDAPAGDDKAGS